MNKNILFKLGIALTAVIVAVLWLLSITVPDTFGFFNLSWAITVFAAISGVAYVLKGIFEKKAVPLKKFNILFGAILIIISIICLASAIAIPSNIILPIIAIVLTLAVFIGILAVGGRKWDSGDNKKVGYKNYYERKAEEEKRADKENKNND